MKTDIPETSRDHRMRGGRFNDQKMMKKLGV
jgi:hypothetical protein